ncbi:hypothetical protein Esti_005169 [Eimeria stiedai]
MEEADQPSQQQQQQHKQQQQQQLGQPALSLSGVSNGSKAGPSNSSAGPLQAEAEAEPAASAAAARSTPLPKRHPAAAPAAAAAASLKQRHATSWRVRRRPPAFMSPEAPENGSSAAVQQQRTSDLITQERPRDRASTRTGRSRDRSSSAAAAAGATSQPAHFPPPPMPPCRSERNSGSLRAPIILSVCFPGWFSRQSAGKGVKIPKPDVRIDPPPELVPFLPPQLPKDKGKKTLVLDLDETLVRSTFAKPAFYTFVIKVELDGKERPIYINKRPGVTLFLNEVAKLFEVVIFTASVSKYADPVVDQLDPTKLCSWRLFREYCTYMDGVFVKDLSLLGRDLKNIVIIDNSTRAYLWHAENAIPIKSWFEDPHDRELLDLIPILKSLAFVHDIRPVIRDVLRRLS